jgi:hypothetical protein
VNRVDSRKRSRGEERHAPARPRRHQPAQLPLHGQAQAGHQLSIAGIGCQLREEGISGDDGSGQVSSPALLVGSTALFVLAISIYDRRTRGRLHPVTLWGGLALLLSFPGRAALAKTGLWLSAAAWLIH